MPKKAVKVDKEQALKKIEWGQVMECIMAQNNGKKGDNIAAAVVITNVKDKAGKHLGGFACEYAGSENVEGIKKSLLVSIRGMIIRRNMGDIGLNAKWGEEVTTEKNLRFIQEQNSYMKEQNFKNQQEQYLRLFALCHLI